MYLIWWWRVGFVVFSPHVHDKMTLPKFTGTQFVKVRFWQSGNFLLQLLVDIWTMCNTLPHTRWPQCSLFCLHKSCILYICWIWLEVATAPNLSLPLQSTFDLFCSRRWEGIKLTWCLRYNFVNVVITTYQLFAQDQPTLLLLEVRLPFHLHLILPSHPCQEISVEVIYWNVFHFVRMTRW